VYNHSASMTYTCTVAPTLHRPTPPTVIPSGATRLFLAPRFVGRRVAQSRNLSSSCTRGFFLTLLLAVIRVPCIPVRILDSGEVPWTGVYPDVGRGHPRRFCGMRSLHLGRFSGTPPRLISNRSITQNPDRREKGLSHANGHPPLASVAGLPNTSRGRLP
jgi:hypothetical protein